MAVILHIDLIIYVPNIVYLHNLIMQFSKSFYNDIIFPFYFITMNITFWLYM